MFTSPGTRAGRGESKGFFRKAMDRMFGSSYPRLFARTSAGWSSSTLNAFLSSVLGNGTSGQAIVGDGSGNFSLGTVGGGAGGAMVAVGTATVTGSAATTLTISGLDLNTDVHYYIEWSLLNANNVGSTISWFFNSDTTNANYDNRSLTGSGSAASSSTQNTPAFVGLTSNAGGVNGSAQGVAWLAQDLYSKPTVRMLEQRDATTGIVVSYVVIQWRTASTNVTGITLSANVANALQVGSYIKVWKFVAA